MSLDQEKKIVELFKHYTSDYKVAYEHFLDFRKQEGSFGSDRHAWDYSDKPALFWRSMELSSLVLALFARRVLTSIANSVPSERAFSNMNYIHNKLRNQLDVERANKLQFVHMNADHSSKQQEADTQARLLAMEEEYSWLYRQE
jgi:hypothetical protein